MSVVRNDLFDYGLSIFQDTNGFKFSLDSILLAEFVENSGKNISLVDFCSGNAAVPLIISTRMPAKSICFEIQKRAYELAYSSVIINNLEDNIKVVNDNLSNVLEYVLPETVDVVTCNPPYFKYSDEANINTTMEKAIARHEITTNLDEIVMSSKYILKNKGSLYLVHRPERMIEIFNVLQKYKFAIKKIQFIYSNYKKDALMILIKAVKNGRDGLKVNPPININDYNSYKKIFE